jgi:hypothetical protein
MRRDTRAAKVAEFTDMMPKIQRGLRSIHSVRLKIEEVVTQNPDSCNNPQMIQLVTSVRKNIVDIHQLLGEIDLDALDRQNATVVNKLRNDVGKEEV